MKKSVGLVLTGIVMLIAWRSDAQTYAQEALIFSRTTPGGSARVQSLGGAQVALGGDYSSAYSNPAGLGFFNKSEATFSFGNSFYSSSSSYLGQNTSDSKSNFHVPGFSLVLHTDKNNGKLISGNFAISFNRISNFNQSFTYSGTNTQNSMIDFFIQQSNGLYPDQFSAGDNVNPPGVSYYTLSRLGFDNYLFGPSSEVNYQGDSSQYHTYAKTIPSYQREQVKTTGAQNQWNIAYGLNFNDFLYVGATLGITTLNYNSKRVYTEAFTVSSPLANFELDENLHVTGTGVNGTLGVIVKPKDFIQIGLSATTPTAYPTLSENYSATLSSSWNSYYYTDVTYPKYNTTLTNLSSTLSYDVPFLYGLTTPWRLRGGLTCFIQKHGFITAEIEKVNYSNAKFSSNTNTPYDFSSDNSDVKTSYRNVFNIRGGGEFRYKNYRVRAGYSYMPDPYNISPNGVDHSVSTVTAGVGYRVTRFYVDLGISMPHWKSAYTPYTLYNNDGTISNATPAATITHSSPTAIVTFGFVL